MYASIEYINGEIKINQDQLSLFPSFPFKGISLETGWEVLDNALLFFESFMSDVRLFRSFGGCKQQYV